MPRKRPPVFKTGAPPLELYYPYCTGGRKLTLPFRTRLTCAGHPATFSVRYDAAKFRHRSMFGVIALDPQHVRTWGLTAI